MPAEKHSSKTLMAPAEKRSKLKKIMSNKYAKTAIGCATIIIWGACAFIASQYIIAYPMLWILGKNRLSQTFWTALGTVLIDALAIFLILFVPYKINKKHKASRDQLGLTGLPTWTDIGLSPIAFIVSTIASLALVAVFSLFPWFNADQAQQIGMTYYTSTDRIIVYISTCIIVPIAEEIMFRGWLYGKLRAKLSMPLATLLVSLLFGLAHGQWNVGVNVFAFSVVLCGLREITGTIYAGTLTHILKNSFAIILRIVTGM